MPFVIEERGGLLAPVCYWNACPELIEEVCNGCGPWGIGAVAGMKAFGVDLNEACGIHDFMYHFGKTAEDKKLADETFLENMYALIDIAGQNAPFGTKWITRARKRWAFRYYNAVVKFGGIAFGGNE